VWVHESWLSFAGLVLQTRMVVVRVEGDLLLYSPSPAVLDAATRDELASLGKPGWLVAPNEIHNVGLTAFQAAYPSAHTTGCAGHPARAPSARFDVLVDTSTPQPGVPWTRSGEVVFHVIGGNCFLREIAVLHVPSKTLILTDAVELIDRDHLGELPGRLLTWMLKRTGLTLGSPCMSPEHNLYCVDPDALEASFGVLAGWDFDSMIIAHGRILDGPEAKDALRRAFEDGIAHARRRSTLTRAFWRLSSRLQ